MIGIKGMSDLIYGLLSVIKDDDINRTDVVLNMPTTKSKFPCRVINTPLESIEKSHNAMPIIKNFQVSIEHWTNTQREAMEMTERTDEQMRTINFIRINTSSAPFDEVTKKYRVITTYENRYYSVNDSFEIIR